MRFRNKSARILGISEDDLKDVPKAKTWPTPGKKKKPWRFARVIEGVSKRVPGFTYAERRRMMLAAEDGQLSRG
jgi:hypothetical protein